MPTLQEAFGVKTLNRIVKTAYDEDQGEHEFFQGLCMQGRPLRLGGQGDPMTDYLEWERVDRPKKPAPFTTRDARFHATGEQDRHLERVYLWDVKLKKHLPGPRIYATAGPGDAVRSDVPGLIADEFEAMRKQCKLAKELAAAQMFQGGTISISATQIEGMETTLEISFPNFSTYSPTAAWGTAGTPIISEEQPDLKTAYYQAARMRGRNAVVGRSVHKFVRGNTEVQSVYAPARTAAEREAGLFSVEPGSVFNPSSDKFELDGVTYHVTETVYDNPASQATLYWPTNALALLPANMADVVGYGEGFGVIPRQAIGFIGGGGISAAPSPGEYSYATVSEDPAGLNLYYGWRGAFAVIFGEGILYRADMDSAA